MTKYNLTIGHYASHRNTGGYQPLKTDIPKAQFPPKSSGLRPPINSLITDEDMWPNPPDTIPPGYYCLPEKDLQPTDLELRIRKDVMDAMEELKSFEDEFEDETEIYFNNLLNKVIDRLKLLWGE